MSAHRPRQRPPIRVQMDVLRLIPAGRDGASFHELETDLARAGTPAMVTAAGPTIDGYPLKVLLHLFRTNGWLIRNKWTDPTTYLRTPTGTARLAQHDHPQIPRMTTESRQEATR